MARSVDGPPSGAARWLGRQPDPRPDQQRLSDKDSVRRQTAGLGRAPRQDAYRRVLLTAVQARRADRPDRRPFSLVELRHGLGTGVVRGELLVRADAVDDASLLDALAPYGFTAAPIEELSGRVLRLSDPQSELTVEQLTDVARFIRTTGHQASVNHITPLGPVMKGRGGPEPTAVALPFPAAPAAGKAPVPIALVDTGVTAEQRTDGWLAGLVTDDNVDPLDDLPAPNGFLDYGAGHGTFTAGIVQQMHPGARLSMYRAVDSDGVGSEADVACAMVRAVRDGARILSLSLGVNTVDDQPLLAIDVALDLIAEMDPEVLVLAAAGNDGSTVPCWPAASKRVVSVAALAADLTPAAWSNHGFWVDCSAVGEGIVSTYVEGVESPELDPSPDRFGGDAWAVWSGTSFAAPQVAGAVAGIAEEEGCTPREALQRLWGDCRTLPDYGRAIPLLPGT
jgi:subtilisin family serine protease